MIKDARFLGVVLFLLIVSSTAGTAQTDAAMLAHTKKYAVGVSGGHYSWDPAIAIEITSPSFFDDHLRVRIRANLQWLEAYKATTEHWITYRSFSSGILYQTGILDRARFYVEAGLFAIFPDQEFSETESLLGFYEINGVEIFFVNTKHHNVSFFIGIGPAIIDARAEKLRGAPRYGSGMQYTNGLRYYF